jgi:hypothetical protein
MSLVIFQDTEGDNIAIDPSRIVMVEASYDPVGCSEITFQLGYRGEATTRTVKHTVLEIVEALNKVDPFG